MGDCLDSGLCCSCSCSCNYSDTGKREAIVLTWANISWLDSAIGRGVGGYAIRCKHIDVKETLSQKVKLLNISN